MNAEKLTRVPPISTGPNRTLYAAPPMIGLQEVAPLKSELSCSVTAYPRWISSAGASRASFSSADLRIGFRFHLAGSREHPIRDLVDEYTVVEDLFSSQPPGKRPGEIIDCRSS